MVKSGFFAPYAILLLVLGTSLGSATADTVDPPKKQLERGVAPENIVCAEGLVLAIMEDGRPVCISPSSAAALEARGFHLEYPEPSEPKDQPGAEKEPQQKTPESAGTSDGSSEAAIKGQSGRTDAKIENIPASGGSIVNFYVTDDDLNTSPNGVDIISTEGLLEFTINGVTVEGPQTMIETGPNTGKFYVRLQLPSTIDGRPISQDDVIQIRYNDQSDAAGEQRTSAKSLPLSSTTPKCRPLAEAAGSATSSPSEYTSPTQTWTLGRSTGYP